jgi:thioredoxin reductase
MADEADATPTLDPTDVALVAQHDARRWVDEGEFLYREGDVTYDFFVLVTAEVDIVVSVDGGELGETWEILDRQPLPFETSHPGLFAVGDLRSGLTKRVAAAVGEGSAAVRSVHQYLAFAS